jgi:hypothetical protein
MADTSLVDPLGRAIVFADHTWERHILVAHPDMDGGREFVEKAVTSPRAIWTSSSDVNVRIYYGNGPSPYLLVAVKANIVKGAVLTAHLAKRETGARREWPQPST